MSVHLGMTWKALQVISVELRKVQVFNYLFDCIKSQLQHLGSSIFIAACSIFFVAACKFLAAEFEFLLKGSRSLTKG